MPDLIDGSENVSVHGIFNWILLLVIFSVITVIGNFIGYKHPMTDSLVGMGILSLITLIGVWLERYLPNKLALHDMENNTTEYGLLSEILN
jgi:hypothetical protein